MKTGVIIARFQTPYLHEGHIDLIKRVQGKHNRLIIVLGIPPVVGTRRNPYDYHTREKLIKSQFNEVIVLPLSDQLRDDKWSEALDSMLTSAFPNESFRLYGSRDSFIPYYSGNYETEELPEHGDHNASRLRESLSDKVYDSREFRSGILYAYYNQYTKVYPTVDMAVFRNEKSEILLGKKSTNYKWRLIGGFADPEDDSFEAAAVRELREECGPLDIENIQYEMSAKVPDWRYRKEADKIITTVYSCDYLSGETIAQDDIIDLEWFSVSSLREMITAGEITEEHLHIFEKLIKKYA